MGSVSLLPELDLGSPAEAEPAGAEEPGSFDLPVPSQRAWGWPEGSPSSSSLLRESKLTHRARRQSVVGEALCREVGGLGAGPNWASHLLCDLNISFTPSGSHFFVFSPSSRFHGSI